MCLRDGQLFRIALFANLFYLGLLDFDEVGLIDTLTLHGLEKYSLFGSAR